MRELIASQEQELALLRSQLDRVEVVGRIVTPLMLRMIDVLDPLVQVDLPFPLDEGTERIEELRRLMTRADVTSAEKYRQVRSGTRVPRKAVPAVSEACFRPLSSTAAAARCA